MGILDHPYQCSRCHKGATSLIVCDAGHAVYPVCASVECSDQVRKLITDVHKDEVVGVHKIEGVHKGSVSRREFAGTTAEEFDAISKAFSLVQLEDRAKAYGEDDGLSEDEI